VAGTARVAEVAGRDDWRAGIAPTDIAISADVRARLAAEWERIGLLEHASIAAFARFALQLLALGAPRDLVEDAQRAMADETRHAELAFALASAYGGAARGPGRFAIDGCLDGFQARATIATLIRRGARDDRAG
jgi:hypothetical protein